MAGPMVLADPHGVGRDTAIPVFHFRAVRDREGNFSDVPYVEIIVPGMKDKHSCPVEPEHQRRWPNEWRAFLDKKELPLNGTPLAEWPAVTPADKAALEANGVKTVEALLNLPENNLSGFGPHVLQLKYKAAEWLSARGGWEAEKKELVALREQNRALEERLAALEAKPKKVKKPKNPPEG